MVFTHAAVGIVLVLASFAASAEHQELPSMTLCEPGEFFDVKTNKCKDCSLCRVNEKSVKSCGGFHDNICGQYSDFFDFSFLNKKTNEQDTRTDNSSEKEPKHTQISVPEVIEANDEEQQWKTLSFVLIGMISALIIVATVIVIISCHRFRHYHWLCKAVTSEQGGDDVENGYVVIHRFLPDVVQETTPPGQNKQDTDDHIFVEYRGRNNRRFMGGYKPKRRLMNEYVDDVFESDDSAGSRVLPTIMERPGESEGSSPSP